MPEHPQLWFRLSLQVPTAIVTPSTPASPTSADFCTNKNNKVANNFLINVLYQLHINVSVFNIEKNVNAIEIKRPRDSLNDRYLGHLRLGHIAEDKVNKLKKSGLLSLLTFESYPVCELCLQGKMTKLSFTGHGERTTSVKVMK